MPTLAREVYDVTGAGDTVVASLSLALVAGASVPEAAQIANLVAGIVVGRSALPLLREELESVLGDVWPEFAANDPDRGAHRVSRAESTSADSFPLRKARSILFARVWLQGGWHCRDGDRDFGVLVYRFIKT